jgi:hypothetical protein
MANGWKMNGKWMENEWQMDGNRRFPKIPSQFPENSQEICGRFPGIFRKL